MPPKEMLQQTRACDINYSHVLAHKDREAKQQPSLRALGAPSTFILIQH